MATDTVSAPVVAGIVGGGEDISGGPEFLALEQAVRPPSASVPANHELAERLGAELLATRSKDLRVATLYATALVHRHGIAGLHRGLVVLHDLLDGDWEQLHPRQESHRRGPLKRLNTDTFAIPLRLQVVMDDAGHTFAQFQQSMMVPTEAQAEKDEKSRKLRAAMLADGVLAPEACQAAFDQTPVAFYEQLATELTDTLTALQRLDAVTKRRFADEAPSYRELRVVVESVKQLVDEQLEKRTGERRTPPPPPPPEPTGDKPETATPPRAPAPEPGDIAARIVRAATELRLANPADPTPYLLLRALRWGEVRALAGSRDETLLVAPEPESRSRLRALYLGGEWDQLLEAVEAIMATPAGRGWLDLQFYCVASCVALGGSYDGVRQAVTGALRALLAELPGLRSAALMDAMPAASPDTQRWLDEVVGLAADGPGDAPGGGERFRRDAYQAARRTAAAGEPERAIQRLMRDVAAETSERGRFLRRTQLAAVMVESRLFVVARPLLEQLIAQIEKQKLIDWEEASVAAQPFALMVRLLDAEEDDTKRGEYHLRVCALDPLQALALKRPVKE
jgi:type VI secretion system protein ImpA